MLVERFESPSLAGPSLGLNVQLLNKGRIFVKVGRLGSESERLNIFIHTRIYPYYEPPKSGTPNSLNNRRHDLSDTPLELAVVGDR